MNPILEKNYSLINEKINKVLFETKRRSDSLDIVAVCKRQPIEKIKYFIQKDIKSFGENRVQDAIKRWKNIKRENLKLHLIGPLQTNKAEEAVKFFDIIETVDREKLANFLSRAQYKHKKNLKYFVQINTGEEEQKSGIIPQEADNFINRCKTQYGLNIVGLMCIPPLNENPAIHFAFLRTIVKRNNLKNLSMGMSNDFEDAIRFGATHIRIGTALFGERLEKEKD